MDMKSAQLFWNFFLSDDNWSSFILILTYFEQNAHAVAEYSKGNDCDCLFDKFPALKIHFTTSEKHDMKIA